MSSSSVEINPRTNKPYSGHCQKVREAARKLPVSQQIDHIKSTVKQNAVTILVGETGSGKTTQVPQALLENLADGMSIAVTQNRRFAADMVASRTAEELDDKVGGLVGLRHRTQDKIDPVQSRLHIITDGSLVALAKADPRLSKYGIIVVDEAHQHTCATDLLLGLLKDLSAKRGDSLKIVIMSATIDTDSFLNFFPGSVVVQVPGRMHPVKVNYLSESVSSGDLTEKIVETIILIHLKGATGNILVFASGVEQIHKIAQKVKLALFDEEPKIDSEHVGASEIFELYAALPAEAQEMAANSLAPPPRNRKDGRKIILATNIAETSVTITGVKYVVDSCRVKSKVYNPENESYALQELWISKAQAQQRSGRAGRTSPGEAYRMCTETGYNTQLTDYTVPDIQNGDMLRECLDILRMGRHPINFPYMFPPATETIVQALEILRLVKAVQISNLKLELTPKGDLMARLPVSIFSAVAILASVDFKCLGEMMVMVSMMEATEGGRNLWPFPKDAKEKSKIAEIMRSFGSMKGGHIMLVNVFLAFLDARRAGNVDQWLQEHRILATVMQQADGIYTQLLTIFVGNHRELRWKPSVMPHNSPVYYAQLLRALAAGYFLQVAKRVPALAADDKKSRPLYETARHGAKAKLAANVQFDDGTGEWVIYNEFSDKGQSKSELRLVTPVPLDTILMARPDYWWDMEFVRNGHVREAVVQRIAEISGQDASTVQGGMPSPAEPRTE
ncbi:putative pre-mRNA-splicing factor ATP-dependent RNA helicase [Hortaea werneckii]|nr:putative pre-mRNA-splicing factor ATP-dependent RNA helicase [Hortaea werneckii]